MTLQSALKKLENKKKFIDLSFNTALDSLTAFFEKVEKGDLKSAFRYLDGEESYQKFLEINQTHILTLLIRKENGRTSGRNVLTYKVRNK